MNAINRTAKFGELLRRLIRLGCEAACAILSAASLLASDVTASQPLIPPQSTVVLLSGLPGDVESENAYRDQLQNWIELLSRNGNARKIFVLCDNPESVSFLDAARIEVSKADRTNFLAIGQVLKGTSNRLVVIAWGHGGRQGNTPVFHVRGPRLTPADFKGLAANRPEANSRWILMFRESGAFAAELAGANRQILSSENTTAFTSDPIGLSVLLKSIHANPEASFDRLCDVFGAAVAAWYKERNLARTEEPALWIENEKPRLLAAPEQESTLAATKPTVAVDATAATRTNGSSPKTMDASTASSDLPAIWKEIHRVEPGSYPGADGVTLRRRVSYTLASNPAVVSEQEEFIQVLTPEGKRLGDFDVSYSPPGEDISFTDCEVLSPDGKLRRLDPDAIRESRAESVGDYQRERRKFFSLPGVTPGAVLRVRYRTEWKSFPLPYFSMQLPIDSELPTVEATMEVTVPKDSAFHFALDDSTAPDPVLQQGTYGTTYAWHFKNLAAKEHELLSSPRQQSRLMVSTFPDWKAFAEWYARISKLTDEVTPEIEAKAIELTREAKNDREKVIALFNFVTSLRYVAIPLGVNSFRPHAAATVLQNQFGDCKDKANLFNALLHALKMDAHLVLVPRFSQADESIPGLAFNHAISRLTLGGATVWADTTDDVCRFGMLPPGDPGRKVLVIDGQTSALTQLPEPEPRQHELKLRGVVDGANPGEALPTTLSATASGYSDYEFREVAREAREHSASLPLLQARFRPVAGAFALEKQSSSPVSALGDNFSWQAAGSSIGLASVSAGKCVLYSPFWVPREWDLALHQRKTALFLNQGYPLTLEEEFEISLSSKAQTVALPAMAENREGTLRWKIEWKTSDSGKLVASFRAELLRGELTPEETRSVQKQLRALLSALSASAAFTLSP